MAALKPKQCPGKASSICSITVPNKCFWRLLTWRHKPMPIWASNIYEDTSGVYSPLCLLSGRCFINVVQVYAFFFFVTSRLECVRNLFIWFFLKWAEIQ